jgi:hypothetical protein
MVPLAELYETDFYAWTRHQARELRRLQETRPNIALDLEHLEEEMRDLGSDRRDACRSQVERILEHFLKLRHSPAEQPRRGWRRSIADARLALSRKLSRSLRRDLRQQLPTLYRHARKLAVLGMEEYAEDEAARLLPETSPFSLDDVLREDWYPEPLTGHPDAG